MRGQKNIFYNTFCCILAVAVSTLGWVWFYSGKVPLPLPLLIPMNIVGIIGLYFSVYQAYETGWNDANDQQWKKTVDRACSTTMRKKVNQRRKVHAHLQLVHNKR